MQNNVALLGALMLTLDGGTWFAGSEFVESKHEIAFHCLMAAATAFAFNSMITPIIINTCLSCVNSPAEISSYMERTKFQRRIPIVSVYFGVICFFAGVFVWVFSV